MNIVTSLLSSWGLGHGVQPPSFVPYPDDPSPQHTGDFGPGEHCIFRAATDSAGYATPRQHHAGRSASTPASTYEDVAIQNLRAERELKLLMDARQDVYVRLTELATVEKRTQASAFQSKTQTAALADRREKLQHAMADLGHKIGNSLLACPPLNILQQAE